MNDHNLQPGVKLYEYDGAGEFGHWDGVVVSVSEDEIVITWTPRHPLAGKRFVSGYKVGQVSQLISDGFWEISKAK